MIKRHKNKHKMKNESILFVLASCIRFEKEMKENIDSRIKCLIMQLLNYRHRRWLEKKKLSMDSVHMWQDGPIGDTFEHTVLICRSLTW